MKRLLLTVAVVAALRPCEWRPRHAAGGTDYYLALGDSLARGFQPDGYVARRSHCSRVISYSTSPSSTPSTGPVMEVGNART